MRKFVLLIGFISVNLFGVTNIYKMKIEKLKLDRSSLLQAKGKVFSLNLKKVSFSKGLYKSDTVDEYGYTAVTISPGKWVELKEMGSAVEVPAEDFDVGEYPGDDALAGPFDIGFDFPFYWYRCSQFYINVNGAISFSDTIQYAPQWSGIQTTLIPSPKRPNDLVIPLGGDLTLVSDYPTALPGARILYYTNNKDTLIVQWDSLREWTTGGPQNAFTFQLILCKTDSSITFNYKIVETNLSMRNCVGIENIYGNIGIQYLRDTTINILLPGRSIKFIPPAEGKPIHDVTVIAGIDEYSQFYFLSPYSVFNIGLTKVQNLGNYSESFPCVCQIVDAAKNIVFIDSAIIAQLDSGATAYGNFNHYWIVTEGTGDYNARFIAQLKTDIVARNDTLIVPIRVVELPDLLYYDDSSPEYLYAFRYESTAIAVEYVPPAGEYMIDFVVAIVGSYEAGNKPFRFLIMDEIDTTGFGHIIWDTVDISPPAGYYAYYVYDFLRNPLIIKKPTIYLVYQQLQNSTPGHFDVPVLFEDANPPHANRYFVYSPGYGWSRPSEYMDQFFWVWISPIPERDVSILKILSPKGFVAETTTYTPTVRIKSFGKENVDCKLNVKIINKASGDTIYDEIVDVPSLSFQEIRDIKLPAFTTGLAGEEYRIEARTILDFDERTFNDTMSAEAEVTGRDYILWDPSGTGYHLYELLKELGHFGLYWTGNLSEISILDQFPVLFITCGKYDGGYVIQESSPDAQAIREFLEAGGKGIYIEGEKVWYTDPVQYNGMELLPLFGCTSGGARGPFWEIHGVTGSLCEGYSFDLTATASMSNNYFVPSQAESAFYDNVKKYVRSVYYEADKYRAWGTSVPITYLPDTGTAYVNVKQLYELIYEFLTYQIPTKELKENLIALQKCNIYPNPTKGILKIYSSRPADIEVFDINGRKIKSLSAKPEKGEIKINLKELPAGVYFVKVNRKIYKVNLVK